MSYPIKSQISDLVNTNELTLMEGQCLQALIDNLYAEAGFSDVDAGDIAAATKIPIKSVRGVLSSLVKKRYINIDDNHAGYMIIYLREDHYVLHSDEWVAAANIWAGCWGK